MGPNRQSPMHLPQGMGEHFHPTGGGQFQQMQPPDQGNPAMLAQQRLAQAMTQSAVGLGDHAWDRSSIQPRGYGGIRG